MENDRKQKFMSLYLPVHERFERFCAARAYGEMDFQDLMQETVVIAWKSFEELKPGASLLSFMCGIAIRILANENRKKKTREKWQNSIDVRPVSEQNNDDVQLLYAALSELPDLQRDAIILFEIIGHSIKEIAVLQNSGESAVKQRLARARESLKAIIETKYQPTNEVRHVK